MRPESPQFGAQPGAMSQLDLDLANIRYVHNIPIVSTDMKPQLDARIEAISAWLAWELTRAEDNVQRKIKSSDLPTDDSVASKLKRMSYRSKVITYTRTSSHWLEAEPSPPKTSRTSAGEDKIKLAVEQSILEAFGTSSSPRVFNALKAVGFDFNGILRTVHPYLFCVIDYDSDITDTVHATIRTFLYNVTVKEGRDPSAHQAWRGFSHRDRGFAQPEAKFYEAEIVYTHDTAYFKFDQWDKSAPKEATSYAVGKQVLAQRQVRLLKE